jgi:chromosome partitioning protein
MSHVISVVNHKGGVGKTTSAVNVAACLGEMGQRVLLVDMDPQGSASLFLGVEDDGSRLLAALQRLDALPLVGEVAAGVDLVPAGPHLFEAAQRLTVSMSSELLSRCLARTKGRWDWVLVDCPPNMGVLTVMALRAGSHALIPVETNWLATRGLDQLLHFFGTLSHHVADVEVAAILPCRAQPRRKVHGQILAELEARFPGKVAPAVRETVALAEAPARSRPVIVSAPRSHGAEDYRAVAAWLAARMGGAPD